MGLPGSLYDPSDRVPRTAAMAALVVMMATWCPSVAIGGVPQTPAEPAKKAAGDPGEACTGSKWPMISVALQDTYYETDLSQVGVLNDAWTISQYALGSVTDSNMSREDKQENLETNIQDFIEMPASAIQASLDRYIMQHPQLSRKTTATIIVDIEGPVHPRHFWKLMGGENYDQITPEFTGIVQAYARRYTLVHDTFPNATVTAFGIGSPDSQGRERDVEARRLHAEIVAARMGMLENLDAISPVLYERFGPDERAFKHMERSTTQGMRNALQIIQASGRQLDIQVLLSLTVFNGNSDLEKKPADLEGIADRLAFLATLGVRRVIFWNAGPTLLNSQITIIERFRQLRAIQQRRARSPGDQPVETSPAEPVEESNKQDS